MQFLTTKEFAEKIGVHENTLRRWEKKGLVVPHHRTPSGFRQYELSQAKDILKLTDEEFNERYKEELNC